MNIREKFVPFKEKMEAENLPEIVIKSFEFYYTQLLEGETGIIKENEIEPVENLPDLEKLDDEYEEYGKNYFNRTVVIKLNGGLGTSMGLNKAKSLLQVKNGLTFLDIIARQAINTKVPLILMNSFNTHADSIKLLGKYPELQNDLPLDFQQHKIPKISKDDFSPVNWKEDPKLEWCPPGHGEIYLALTTSGILDKLLKKNFSYAFISNSDNLGAFLEPKILGYLVKNNLPFLMEVADRTEADKKGGHLAYLKSGGLILRESAQCADDDVPDFQNIEKHKYFNTNNIWVNLKKLKEILDEKNAILGLPMIRNEKTVDPRNASSPKVYQLETAMGSAISVFEGAGAIRVPRTRFAPVKTTNDLLVIRSDAYILTDDFKLVPSPERQHKKLYINLDPTHYKKVDDFDERFDEEVPSLIDCQELIVEGDFKFGANVKIKGKVKLVNEKNEQKIIPEGEILSGK